jgi:transcriptional regulator with XRE-family HTH domain
MQKVTRSRAVEDRPLARAIGTRLRAERLRQGLTQSTLAGERYTKAYISALENGLAKPSMAALNYLAGRLGIAATSLMAEEGSKWTRIEVDLRLAAGDWQSALDGYTALIEGDRDLNRAELLRGLAEAAARLDRGTEAVRAGSEAASLFDSRGRAVDAAWARYWEAFGLYELDQPADSRRILAGILDRLASGHMVEPDLHVRAIIALAMVESREDEPERALALLEQARGLVDGLDDRRRATFLFSLALSYREVGDLEAAITTANQSLSHFKAAAAELEVASLENELALVYLGLGNLERAREHVAAARATFERDGNDRWLAHVTETEAQIELASGAPERAADRAAAALRLARASGNRKAELSSLMSLARARSALGTEGALEPLEEAAALAREHGRRGQLQAILGELARVVADQGDLKRAFQLSQEALAAGRKRS